MIINPSDFTTIEKVRLNRGGKIIGEIVKHKGRYYYISPRTDEHFYRIKQGFGIDASLLRSFIIRKFQTELQKKYNMKFYIEGIIIHYRGKREKRYYFADIDTWFLHSNTISHAKGDTGETYGIQKILPIKHMKILGYDKDDFTILNKNEKMKKWTKY